MEVELPFIGPVAIDTIELPASGGSGWGVPFDLWDFWAAFTVWLW